MNVAALFAGIAGIEKGLERAGHQTQLLVEFDPVAQTVLRHRMPGVRLHGDVQTLPSLPKVDLVTAGFPCTDLSQAGRKQGITGQHSGLVGHVFRLLDEGNHPPDHVLLENVSYMLRLEGGAAMDFLVRQFEDRGYDWAYRVVDARAFGVPQRRQRVIMFASRSLDPRTVLFADDSPTVFDDGIQPPDADSMYGFYWTEGLRGLGWAKNAVPTIKGGSGLGIPSAPAIWRPLTGEVGTPSIEDAERLQGFDADWTSPATEAGHKAGLRWRLVGNAVCVGMSEWAGRRIDSPGPMVCETKPLPVGARWPNAASGVGGVREAVAASMTPYPVDADLRKFLTLPLRPLSHRATNGFVSRARRGKLRFPEGFLQSLDAHIEGFAE